jgi:monoamine oxidase
MKLSRRALLLAPLLAAAPRDPDVIIVGAGMAGIAAGLALRQRGVRVLLLEARSRVGGRAWSLPLSAGRAADLGAAWLHSYPSNPLTPLVRVPTLIDRSDEHSRIVGSLVSPETFEAAYSKADTRIEQDTGPDVAASQLFAPSTAAEQLAVGVIGGLDAGVDWETLSSADWRSIAPTGQDKLIPSGFGTWVSAQASGLPVLLNSPVQRVLAVRGGIEVRRADGQSQRVRAVIITVPLGVLAAGGLEITPRPPQLEAALAGVRMGLLNKIILTTAPGTLPPVGNGEWVLLPEGAAVFALHRPASLPDTLIYFSGARAGWDLEQRSTAELSARATKAVQSAYGVTARVRWISRWGADPWARGAYSAARPGGAAQRKRLSEPWDADGRIVYAGEACAGLWATMVSGAWLAGRAAAERIRL